MEIFHQSVQYTTSNLFDFIAFILHPQFMLEFCSWIFENEVITDIIHRYIHSIIQSIRYNAYVCIYSRADLNVGHCAELTFLESKMGRFRKVTFLK